MFVYGHDIPLEEALTGIGAEEYPGLRMLPPLPSVCEFPFGRFADSEDEEE